MWLDRWLFEKQKTRVWLSKKLKISIPYACKIVAGERVPSRKLAYKIQEITEGEISAEECLFGDMSERKVRFPKEKKEVA